MKFDIHKKEWEGLLYENGAGEKIVSHSKLKLWTFFWGHGEREWPLPQHRSPTWLEWEGLAARDYSLNHFVLEANKIYYEVRDV